MTQEKDVEIICRCEDVTRNDVVKAIEEGHTTLMQIKNRLRCGMGICQGKRCLKLVAQIVFDKTGVPVAEQEFPRVRPPTTPFPLAALVPIQEETKDQ